MKKIIFGITSLSLGGAERILVDLANALSGIKDYDITIFTLYGEGEFEKELDKKVHLVKYYQSSFLHTSFFKRKLLSLKILNQYFREKMAKRYFEGYDVKIAFLEGPVTMLMSRIADVAWVHNDIEKVFGNDNIARKKYQLYEKIYSMYKKIVFVSVDNLNSFNKFYQNDSEKMVIYNYLDEKKVKEKSFEKIEFQVDKEKLNFVVVARLTKQKGLERLLDVHNELIKQGLKHHIYVIGDGPLKMVLKEKIENLRVKDTFHLLGKKENPYPYMRCADVFMLPSLYEGYPMVLVEAKILGKFILVTNTAAKEVVEGYQRSLLVENSALGIKKGMEKLIKEGFLDEDLEGECYSSRKSLDEVIRLIEEVK